MQFTFPNGIKSAPENNSSKKRVKRTSPTDLLRAVQQSWREIPPDIRTHVKAHGTRDILTGGPLHQLIKAPFLNEILPGFRRPFLAALKAQRQANSIKGEDVKGHKEESCVRVFNPQTQRGVIIIPTYCTALDERNGGSIRHLIRPRAAKLTLREQIAYTIDDTFLLQPGEPLVFRPGTNIGKKSVSAQPNFLRAMHYDVSVIEQAAQRGIIPLHEVLVMGRALQQPRACFAKVLATLIGKPIEPWGVEDSKRLATKIKEIQIPQIVENAYGTQVKEGATHDRSKKPFKADLVIGDVHLTVPHFRLISTYLPNVKRLIINTLFG